MYKYWTSDNSRLILVATMEVIRSNNGKPKLLFENYAYLIKHQKITSIGIAKAASKQLMTWTTLCSSNVCESTTMTEIHIRWKAINREHEEGETV